MRRNYKKQANYFVKIKILQIVKEIKPLLQDDKRMVLLLRQVANDLEKEN